mgnify:CR=1 FL=1
MYDGRLTPALAATTFRNIDRLFPSRIVAHGPTAVPLLPASTLLSAVTCTSRDQVVSLDEYMRLNRVSGLLVLKQGRIALERYALGATPATHWMSMSVAKSITSTLIGIALHEGRITSLDEPVTKYVPSLAGSAYTGVTIRQVLMMASGVKWNETYTDPSSDRRRLLDAQIAQTPGAALSLMASLPRAVAAGSTFNYSTGETLVAGEVVRGAVGTSLSAYLSEKLWKPIGMESDATWWLDSPDGHEIAGSGISATLRDYARFGQFFLTGGLVAGTRVLPEGWLNEAGSPKTLSSGRREQYGYMWWPVDAPAGSINANAFSAQGIFGQSIYINPREQVVIVQLAAQTKPTGGDVLTPEDCFGAMTEQLRAQAPPAPTHPGAAQGRAMAIARARADSARYPYTDADVAFMTGMIEHHAQAIVMSKWVPTHNADPAVQRLAERIINAQEDEIATMQRWLADRGKPVPDAKPMAHDMPGMDHTAMMMPGMLSDAQMKELDASRGPDFDRLFLLLMIQHHKGATAMVTMLFGTTGAGQDETIFKFASDVNVDQTTEIARMQRMLFEFELKRAGTPD